jgi:hypothetical protein
MSTKFRPGSMGAAEEKSNKRWRIGTLIVAIVVFLCFFVFKTDMHDLVKKASWLCNIAGLIVFLFGFTLFAFGEEVADRFDLDVQGFSTAALVVVGLGLWFTTGFSG